MDIIINTTKRVFNVCITLILIIGIYLMLINQKAINRFQVDNADKDVTPFSFTNKDITYEKTVDEKASSNVIVDNVLSAKRTDVISRAKAMADVKWIPKYDIKSTDSNYTFTRGKTYTGIPYTMGIYQVSSVGDFSNKIKNSKVLYGNDCSGFVSTAWGISRQTTLTIFNSVKYGTKLDGHLITQISWEELKAGDALLKDNGKGDGHIMLYSSADSKNLDNIYVYEQNVSTVVPFAPLPAARKDIRSKAKLKEYGYIPIRLEGLN